MNVSANPLPTLVLTMFVLSGPTVSAQGPSPCRGDCSADGQVAINELITGVAILIGTQSITRCVALDTSDDPVSPGDEPHPHDNPDQSAAA